MTTPLTLPRFRDLVAAYGAEPARWPAAERDAAQALLAQSPEAQALLARERRLDTLLDGVDTPPLPAGLYARILRTAPQPRTAPWRRVWDELGGWRLLAPGLAAALAIGVGIGAWLPAAPIAEDADFDVLTLAQFDAVEADVDTIDMEVAQ